MKYALIGNGYIGKRHIDSIKSIGGELLMVCDENPKRKVKGLAFYGQFTNMKLDPRWKEVEFVVVATPNDLHIPMSMWAVGQNKKVICEKPLNFNSEELFKISGIRNIFTCLQLRHHPEVKEILASKEKPKDVRLYVKVKRDESYWKGWKGDESRSGGMLFNLGVHYFDILFQLFGDGLYQVTKHTDEPDCFIADLRFYGMAKPVMVEIKIDGTDEGQERYLQINDRKYTFSNADNLSSEDLHKEIYREALDGRGVFPAEVYELTRMIEKIRYGL